MREKETRFSYAITSLRASTIDPIETLIAAATDLNLDLKEQVEMLESLRPHWARGYTSDSQAAQQATNALSQLWALLEVDNQTAAVTALMKLKAVVPRENLEDRRPFCIYHDGDIAAYYEASIEEQDAWNAYANKSAREFDDSGLDSYDSTSTYPGRNRDGETTKWSPAIYFPEWLREEFGDKK